MTIARWSSVLALVTVCLAAAQADAQTRSRGYATTESGSYLNLAPRQRMAQPALVQAPRVAPPEATPGRSPERTVVCGMTMLPGDNAVDQKMVLTAPDGQRGGATRAYRWPMCAPEPAAVRR